jgi:hypothetical protein
MNKFFLQYQSKYLRSISANKSFRFFLSILLLSQIVSCKSFDKKPDSAELISDPLAQDSVFKQLLYITRNNISDSDLKDSLAFLVLPLQASCPSCRKKTIDSIIQHKDNLKKHHFIILSASAGIKKINSYFLEQGKELPDFKGQFFIDSANLAYKYNLFKDNPAFYYAYKQKVYKKVSAIPATIRDDLSEFFSGKKQKTSIAKKE